MPKRIDRSTAPYPEIKEVLKKDNFPVQESKKKSSKSPIETLSFKESWSLTLATMLGFFSWKNLVILGIWTVSLSITEPLFYIPFVDSIVTSLSLTIIFMFILASSGYESIQNNKDHWFIRLLKVWPLMILLVLYCFLLRCLIYGTLVLLVFLYIAWYLWSLGVGVWDSFKAAYNGGLLIWDKGVDWESASPIWDFLSSLWSGAMGSSQLYSFFQNWTIGEAIAIGGVAWALVEVFIGMVSWFSMPLTVIEKMKPCKSMYLSIKAVIKNYRAVLLLLPVYLAIFATVFIIFGMFGTVIPVLALAGFPAAYIITMDVFGPLGQFEGMKRIFGNLRKKFPKEYHKDAKDI